jgi:hypothetical protein
MTDKRADLERRADAIAERVLEKRKRAPPMRFESHTLIAPELDNTAPEEPAKHERGRRVFTADPHLSLHLETSLTSSAFALEKKRALTKESGRNKLAVSTAEALNRQGFPTSHACVPGAEE